MLNQLSHDTKSILYMVMGGVLLVATVIQLMHIAFWLVAGIAGYKLLDTGMRMRGYPPLFFLFTRFLR